MNVSYNRHFNIGPEVIKGDVDLRTIKDGTGDGKLYFDIQAVMFPLITTTADTAGTSKLLVCELEGGSEQVTYSLLPNVPLELKLSKIIKTGTATGALVLLGNTF